MNEEIPIPRRVVRAFVFVVVVAFAVACVLAWQIDTTMDLAEQNQVIVRKLAEADTRIELQSAKVGALNKAQDESCTNYETLKSAVNAFNGTLHRLIASGIKTRTARIRAGNDPTLKADRAAVALSVELFKETSPITASCAQKKSQTKKRGGK